MVGYIALPLGLIIAALGFFSALSGVKRKITWKRAEGTVTSVKKQKTLSPSATTGGNTASTTTRVNFLFTDEAGETHTGSCTPLLSFRKPKRKGPIPIEYDPETPAFNQSALPGEFAVGLGLSSLPFMVGAALFTWGFLDVLG